MRKVHRRSTTIRLRVFRAPGHRVTMSTRWIVTPSALVFHFNHLRRARATQCRDSSSRREFAAHSRVAPHDPQKCTVLVAG